MLVEGVVRCVILGLLEAMLIDVQDLSQLCCSTFLFLEALKRSSLDFLERKSSAVNWYMNIATDDDCFLRSQASYQHQYM